MSPVNAVEIVKIEGTFASDIGRKRTAMDTEPKRGKKSSRG